MYFFLLVLGILLNFAPDAVHKRNKFSNVFPKKGFKLILSGKSGPIIFDLSLMLLSAKVDLIPEEQGCKRDAFVTLGLSGFEMVFVLVTKVVAFHVQVSKV